MRLPDDIFNDMKRLQDEFNSIFRQANVSNHTRSPVSDVYETESDVLIDVELPGIKKEDIDITINNNTLLVKAEHQTERENQDGETHRIERSKKRFKRRYQIPRHADGEHAEATYDNGVLRITMPKDDDKGKKIDIK